MAYCSASGYQFDVLEYFLSVRKKQVALFLNLSNLSKMESHKI